MSSYNPHAMRYLSVCSGIEAATVAWKPLGWQAVGFSEIEKFPAAVLAHHYPDVPNLGDMTKFKEWPDDLAPDLIVGGTPCQSFSVAGLRKGLADPRGNLALTYLALADRYRPEWLVWENVPGVLSSNGGRDFGAFLGGLVELGYGFAYRVLDAQYFGVAQRRRRVFVVANARDWRRAAAVLFEPHSLSGDPAPRREAGEEPAKCLTRGAAQRFDAETETMIPVAHTLRGEGFDASEDGTGRGTPLVPVAFSCKDHGADAGEISPTLRAMGHGASHANAGGQVAVAFDWQSGGDARGLDPKDTAQLQRCQVPATMQGMAVRRLTPVECERLQGFPDGYTAIRWRSKPASECPDGPRYKALGNSMAVPVMAWIGERIAAVASQENIKEAA